jgi:hypothetical protein
MSWQEAGQVGAVIVAALGGGGAIVLGLSKFVGDIWIERFKVDFEAKIKRLESRLEHGNFLLQRFAEYEFQALTECWRAAKACEPLLNAMRPDDADKAALPANAKALSIAHDRLLRVTGRHAPFLPQVSSRALDSMTRILRLEISNYQTDKDFVLDLKDKGLKNRSEFEALVNVLLAEVQQRVSELRNEAERQRA